jgi:hypothetical protein
VAGEQGVDRGGVAFGEPEALGVFIHDKGPAVRVFAAEQNDGGMGEAVIHGGEPFDAAPIVELRDDMDFAAEGGEELTGSDVPIALEPGAAFPAGEFLEDFMVIGVLKRLSTTRAGMKRVEG